MRDQKLLADAASAESPWRKAVVLSLAVFAALAFAGCSQGVKPPTLASSPVPASSPLPCAYFPTKPAATLEETAWQIFVAATCPNPIPTFETWVEQSNLKSSLPLGEAAGKRQLHGSHLQAILTGGSPGACNPMTTTGAFAPTNLAPGAQFCEEVFVNPDEAQFIRHPDSTNPDKYSLLTLTQQGAYAKNVKPIDFPSTSIEIKADWLPASSLSPAAFNCDGPSSDLYLEKINGTCYALVGLHISSKLYPKWLWATFEPQFPATNPNRCKPDLYNACNDPWGSRPAVSIGAKTELSPALKALMDDAGFHPTSPFRNYRLVGVQNDFVNSNTTQLGNSFIEFNAGVPPQMASCITCHSRAQFDTSTAPPFESGSPMPGTGPMPVPPPVPPVYGQDFSWLLGTRNR